MKNVSSGSFLALEDLQGLSLETSVEVVTGDFPTCWEMEVMDNGSAEDGEDENADVYARYVDKSSCCCAHANCLTLFRRHVSIRLPRSDMALGFKGGYAGAPVRSVQSLWWLVS